ncbi:MAG: hypothetical protein Tsb0021_06740 [Chlamydiales bacterium]
MSISNIIKNRYFTETIKIATNLTVDTALLCYAAKAVNLASPWTPITYVAINHFAQTILSSVIEPNTNNKAIKFTCDICAGIVGVTTTLATILVFTQTVGVSSSVPIAIFVINSLVKGILSKVYFTNKEITENNINFRAFKPICNYICNINTVLMMMQYGIVGTRGATILANLTIGISVKQIFLHSIHLATSDEAVRARN